MTVDTAIRVRLIRYWAAIGMALAAFAIRLGLDPLLGVHAPFLFFLPTVVIAAAIGGLRPGLLASTLGFLGGMAFVPLDDGLAFEESVNVAAYWGMCLLLVWFGQRLHGAQQHATSRASELAAREAHLRSILDTVPDGMIVIDEHGIIQSYSRAAERLFGYAAEEMIGRNVSMLMPLQFQKEDRGSTVQHLAAVMQRVQQKGGVVDGVRNDGTTFPIELFVGEMTIDDKRFFTGFVRDLTEWREMSCACRSCRLNWYTSQD
ncbi:PAS domain S-box protein [Chelativorans sp. AA-79]|uniref:PAS domain S-box protein n=1 Tax=Chelativorans sp. AA-79 TaxID=3028735 RepID=UPI0023F904A1|nr:PAS domain S-box protein [Chelativorans sp. AA-79]WEX08575.1 PAS domain S-box protein [Chelativorans sp. AA-79]